MRGWIGVTASVVAGGLAVAALSSCDAPFSLPSTRALESGVTAGLAERGVTVSGSYTETGKSWTVKLQMLRSAGEHLTATSSGQSLEAIVIGPDAYFRGAAFLAAHLGDDPASRNLLKAAGHAWWRGSAQLLPQLPDLTDSARFGATFLGSNVTARTDHVIAGGVDAVRLSGPRADVDVAAAPPNRLIDISFKPGVSIDGITGARFQYAFDQSFDVSPPADVIDFSDLSTLPPNYTVISVDTSGCASPCVVSAQLKNLGGRYGAAAASTVTFTMTDAASGSALGSCQAAVRPDVGYNGTTTVSCVIALSAGSYDAATVTATPTNPGGA